jgi:hypothetical protein
VVGILFVRVWVAVPVGALTNTESVQLPGVVGLPAGMVPPVKMMLFAVVAEVFPPQLLDTMFTTVNGLGKLSVTLTPVYGEAVGFCSVISSLVVPPAENVDGTKRFVAPIVCTLRGAVASVAFVSCCWVWRRPAGIRLV